MCDLKENLDFIMLIIQDEPQHDYRNTWRGEKKGLYSFTVCASVDITIFKPASLP